MKERIDSSVFREERHNKLKERLSKLDKKKYIVRDCYGSFYIYERYKGLYQKIIGLEDGVKVAYVNLNQKSIHVYRKDEWEFFKKLGEGMKFDEIIRYWK